MNMSNDNNKRVPLEMTTGRALVGFLVPIALMIVLIFSGVSLTLAMFSSVLALCVFGYFMRYPWGDLDTAMSDGIRAIGSAAVIMILVGALIAVFMAAGTIPALLYYGFQIISPRLFLPIAFILSTLVALATGTSWGAVGTMGVALIGMSEGLGVPLYMTAGAIISGAQMGDKMSPLSDTTLLAAASAETSVFKHVISMLYTTVPAFLISLVLYFFIGIRYSGAMDSSGMDLLMNGISSSFNINFLTLIPIIIVLALSIKQIPAFITFSIGIVVSAIWAILFQGVGVMDAFSITMNGFVSDTGVTVLDNLLSRGGINSMLDLVSVVIMAGILSGLLDKMKVLNTLVEVITTKVQSEKGIIASVLASSALLASTGAQYPALTIPAFAFKSTFDKLDIHRAVLSRSMEDTGSLIVAILPWGVSAAFYSAALTVEPLQYIPFTFLPLLTPFIAVINAWTGTGVFRSNDKIKYRPFWRRSKIVEDGKNN